MKTGNKIRLRKKLFRPSKSKIQDVHILVNSFGITLNEALNRLRLKENNLIIN